jgi:hypothetical protein
MTDAPERSDCSTMNSDNATRANQDFNAGNTDPVNDMGHRPAMPSTEGGGSEHRPPLHNADAPDHSEESDGGASGVSHDNDDDLDVAPYDELDEAAAQNKEDWRIPTVAWPEVVSGEEVFNAIVRLFKRFMVLGDGAAEVLALWITGTYALHACNLLFAVRLLITSPGANSGKTTLLDLLEYLVRHPEPTCEISAASLYRALNGGKCVLLDEADQCKRRRENPSLKRPDGPVAPE